LGDRVSTRMKDDIASEGQRLLTDILPVGRDGKKPRSRPKDSSWRREFLQKFEEEASMFGYATYVKVHLLMKKMGKQKGATMME